MDILVVLGILVAVILILIGLYMILQPKFAANKVALKVNESSPVPSLQVESLVETTPEPIQITPVISANDFINFMFMIEFPQ